MSKAKQEMTPKEIAQGIAGLIVIAAAGYLWWTCAHLETPNNSSESAQETRGLFQLTPEQEASRAADLAAKKVAVCKPEAADLDQRPPFRGKKSEMTWLIDRTSWDAMEYPLRVGVLRWLSVCRRDGDFAGVADSKTGERLASYMDAFGYTSHEGE